MWPEVDAAKSENRRELKLTGAQVSERIAKNDGNLDDAIYQLSVLNLLEVSDTALEKISQRIDKLHHLQSLLLYRNRITQVPATIGLLGELKVLDLSGNRLTELPIEFAKLRFLTTLNLSFNRLKTVDLTALEKLSVCNLSGNELAVVPQFHIGQAHHLTEVNLEKNCIVVLPEELTQQYILRVLNVAENKIEQVPKYITKCAKLKEINLKGNPLKDKRLLKLVDQCRTKQVLDYVVKNGYDPSKASAKEDASCAEDPPTAENHSNGSQESQSVQEDESQLKIVVRKATENTPKLTFTPEARANRPYIVLCIVRNFPVTNMRKFLQLQNALHDNECGRREVATIATHDLAKVKGSIRYHAAPPGEIEITALGSAAQGKVTAEKYYADLCHQADQLRKEKKRSSYSGVHKYITLLTAKELFAFLSDEEKVISLPPLTNCDETKISPTSTDVLLEVTSSVGHGHCVRVMNALLEGMLLMDVEVVGGASATSSTPGKASNQMEKKKKSKVSKETEAAKVRYNRSVTLTVEQVQLYDSDGKLHSVFPGKGDLSGNEMARISVEMA
ncbi:leucine-rich repeat-containing protein 47-like [Anopheles marshallii]|uniref:leucine-rich repeat-containing protein 47-like n=1 Tax=Anopheles marshallii TaxID=1521116 RepID=UPI00237BF401|nr:leucine-rich repeat-containing protein 47-like [Anopheles marshallii]